MHSTVELMGKVGVIEAKLFDECPQNPLAGDPKMSLQAEICQLACMDAEILPGVWRAQNLIFYG